MNMPEAEGAIEALLFASGDPVHIKILSEAIDSDADTTLEILSSMNSKYEASCRGFFIKKLEDSYQLCTNIKYTENIRKGLRLAKPQRLTQSLLETLAIIAYLQPVTKQQIMEIRGVDAGHAVNKLIEKKLVCEMGRLEAPGKPILFGTTTEFLRKFGLDTIDELSQKIYKLENGLQGGGAQNASDD